MLISSVTSDCAALLPRSMQLICEHTVALLGSSECCGRLEMLNSDQTSTDNDALPGTCIIPAVRSNCVSSSSYGSHTTGLTALRRGCCFSASD